ncbi:MAG: hypothetical protein RI567_06760 [Marinobacter sp.]|nr:hypothetical protein [Marinobacter sp.]
MKMQICASLIGLVLVGASQSVAAEGPELPDFRSDGYQAQRTLALAAGGMDPGFTSAVSGARVGVRDVEARSHDDALQGQAGASVHFYHGAFFFGGEARYHVSAEERLEAGGWDADNVRVLLKVGVNL